MHEALGVSPSDIIAALGPSIGPCCYEVGAELILKFRAAGFAETEVSRWFSSHGSSLRLDLAGANLDQLVDAGVPASQVFAAGLCTKSHPDWLESFRGEGEGAGRMAGLIACGGGRR
jgi:copper oxidase (laccase) domain-containing protein